MMWVFFFSGYEQYPFRGKGVDKAKREYNDYVFIYFVMDLHVENKMLIRMLLQHLRQGTDTVRFFTMYNVG